MRMNLIVHVFVVGLVVLSVGVAGVSGDTSGSITESQLSEYVDMYNSYTGEFPSFIMSQLAGEKVEVRIGDNSVHPDQSDVPDHTYTMRLDSNGVVTEYSVGQDADSSYLVRTSESSMDEIAVAESEDDAVAIAQEQYESGEITVDGMNLSSQLKVEGAEALYWVGTKLGFFGT